MLRYMDKKYPYILITYMFLYFPPVNKHKNFSIIPISSLKLITKFKNDKILKTDFVGSYNL